MADRPATPAVASSRPTVHLLVVHGVGGHDHLSNLLRTYQSFRANLASVDVPVTFEDLIPQWRLAGADADGAPPSLRLEPRDEHAAYNLQLYEVNYSGLAGVVRRNHKVGLTELFLGLDQAACSGRLPQDPRSKRSVVFGPGTNELGRCLQRVASVLAAGTVPIIGLPSIIFRDYVGTFVRTFTRFFEDVVTFALDKNGEQLISAHFDRTIASIALAPGDRLVVAAHSLGSVVVHNHIVRQWTVPDSRLPETLVTFGSPIGLVAWLWLYLDFKDMDFARPISGGNYFCWNPVSTGKSERRPLTWINVVNCADPIATAFPLGAVDMSAPSWEIANGLRERGILHRFLGNGGLGSVGASHTEYLNDRAPGGFLEIVLQAAGMIHGDPRRLRGRTDDEHRIQTRRLLFSVRQLARLVALAAIVSYFGLMASALGERRVMWGVLLFVWPRGTIEVLAFFQRLMFGGPTKRISVEAIRLLPWRDVAAFPYRLREAVLRRLGLSRNVDPAAPSAGFLRTMRVSVLAFVPTAALMLVPVALGAWLTGAWPTAAGAWSWWSLRGVLAIGLFAAYVLACAAHELLGAWRRVLAILR